jgi:hypothetical protein
VVSFVDPEFKRDLVDLGWIRHESVSTLANNALLGHVKRCIRLLKPSTPEAVRLIRRYITDSEE